MFNRTKILILILFLLSDLLLFSQSPIEIIPDSTCPQDLIEEKIEIDSNFSSKKLTKVIFDFGFPFSVLDSNNKQLNIHCGPKINTIGIKFYSPDTLSQLKKWDFQSWNKALQTRGEILMSLADRGFPYARLKTNFQEISGDTLFLNYQIDSLQEILIQEISVRGNFNIQSELFQKMIGIQEQDPFSWSKIKKSETIINSWSFADFQELNYDFNPFGVNLEYVIDKQDPSKFDILLALVPSNRPNQQYELTGNAYLDLSNQLKLAERIFIQYDKYANQSQSFALQLNFPYIPLIKSGIVAEGMLDRRDTTILDVGGKIGLQYQWNPELRYALFIQQEQSRLVSLDQGFLLQSQKLPDQLDYNWSAVGTSILFNSLNHIQNPTKGSILLLELTGGLKKIIRNSSILQISDPNNDFSFTEAYDSIRQNTLKFELIGKAENFIPVGNFSTIRLRMLGGLNYSTGGLLNNEKFRLGGFQNYRGFAEKIFFADWYGMASAEYRFLFSGSSNAYFFSDFGIFGDKNSRTKINYPYSFGIGLNLDTKAGIFGISYALGGHKEQRISLSEGRVNFGLIVNY